MTIAELNKLTSGFSDVAQLIVKKSELSREINKIRRRLDTKTREYAFLPDMVAVKGSGDKLVDAVVSLFKALGFRDVENVDRKYKEEDIRLRHEDVLLLIEVTGIETPTPKYAKAHQISMHIPNRRRAFPHLKVSGVFIVNHDYSKQYKKRNKKPFTSEIISTASSHNYTLFTTSELLNIFMQFKKGMLSQKEVLGKLCAKNE